MEILAFQSGRKPIRPQGAGASSAPGRDGIGPDRYSSGSQDAELRDLKDSAARLRQHAQSGPSRKARETIGILSNLGALGGPIAGFVTAAATNNVWAGVAVWLGAAALGTAGQIYAGLPAQTLPSIP